MPTHRALATLSTVLLIGLGGGCGSQDDSTALPSSEPSSAGADSASVGSAVESPAAEATRGFDEPGLVEALTGLSEIEPYTIRLAYDLGTVRIVVLARAEQDQSVSVVELLPPPDLTLDSMQAAFDGRGSAEPLEILGYDSVQVLERRSGRLGGHEASFATIQWQRTAPEESGAGSVAWLLCEGSDRWVFVSEEVRGSSHDPSVNADLIESFELCPTGS